MTELQECFELNISIISVQALMLPPDSYPRVCIHKPRTKFSRFSMVARRSSFGQVSSSGRELSRYHSELLGGAFRSDCESPCSSFVCQTRNRRVVVLLPVAFIRATNGSETEIGLTIVRCREKTTKSHARDVSAINFASSYNRPFSLLFPISLRDSPHTCDNRAESIPRRGFRRDGM